MGHVRDLPSKELGFDPQSDFEPKYEIMQSKRKVIQSIKEKKSKQIVKFYSQPMKKIEKENPFAGI